MVISQTCLISTRSVCMSDRFASGQGQHRGHRHQLKEVCLSLLRFKAMK